MLLDLYEYSHHALGIHLWDLPAILVAVITVVVLIVHTRNQKKREDDFNEERKQKLEEINKKAADSVQVQRREGGVNMAYLLEHTKFGFCMWDLIALIVLIIVIAAFVWKHYEMKRELKDLEDQISELYADDTVKMDNQA